MKHFTEIGQPIPINDVFYWLKWRSNFGLYAGDIELGRVYRIPSGWVWVRFNHQKLSQSLEGLETTCALAAYELMQYLRQEGWQL